MSFTFISFSKNIPTRYPIAAIHQLFNFSTFQLFPRACGARAARFPLPPAAPSARRELAT